MSYEDIQKRIRRRKFRFRIILTMIIISGALIYLFTNPVIKVKNIIVKGNDIVPAEKIIELSDINIGENLLLMNMRKIRENIFTNPYIETCGVKRSLFGYVYITVGERKNAGYTQYNGKYITFDKNVVAIEILDKLEGINLPQISGMDIKKASPGKPIEVSDDRQINVIKIVFNSVTSNNLSDIINEVDIKNLISITVKTKYGINIKLGTVDNIDEKLSASKEIIEKDILKRDLKGTLDISFEGNPIFRPE